MWLIITLLLIFALICVSNPNIFYMSILVVINFPFLFLPLLFILILVMMSMLDDKGETKDENNWYY